MSQSIGFTGEYASQSIIARRHQLAIDIVLCVDATASMEDTTGGQQTIIKKVKENALHFHEDLYDRMTEKGRHVHQIRVKIILFRDYIADGENAMLQTDFFVLPQQSAEFADAIKSIRAEGGGDPPEDGLEALAYAIRSDWSTEDNLKRNVIVVLSDTGTHALGYGKQSQYYPSNMPANLDELENWWDAMDGRAKRLIILAPDTFFWNFIGDNWSHTYHIPTAAGAGLSDHQYSEILDRIVHNI